jgi:hypothetical protein
LSTAFKDEEGGGGPKTKVELMWGTTGLSKENVPAWNVSMKGNATFETDYSLHFHEVENQLFDFNTCTAA